jgi:hypothetical protein
MALNIQTPITGITGMIGTAPFENYMAATVEEITIGRDPVTSIAPLPNRVFDIIWKMNLNTALYSIYAQTVVDADEMTSKNYDINNTNYFSRNVYNYTLSTNLLAKDITLFKVSDTIDSPVTKLLYGNVQFQYINNTNSFLSGQVNVINPFISANGQYVSGIVNVSIDEYTHLYCYDMINNKNIYFGSTGTTSIFRQSYETRMSNDGKWLFAGGATGPITGTSTDINYAVEIYQINSTFTGSTYTQSIITNIKNTNMARFDINLDGKVLVAMDTSSTTASSFTRYEYNSGTNQWGATGATAGTNITVGPELSNDGITLVCSTATTIYTYNWNSSSASWGSPVNTLNGLTGTILRWKLVKESKSLVVCTTSGFYIYKNVNVPSTGTFFTFTLPNNRIKINISPDEKSIILSSMTAGTLYKYWNTNTSYSFLFNGTTWSNTKTEPNISYYISDNWLKGMAIMGKLWDIYTLYKLSGYAYYFDMNYMGIGSNESECLIDLAKKLSVTATSATDTTVTLLASDGSQNAYSSIAFKPTPVLSSSILNALTGSTGPGPFMQSIKGMTGALNWYSITGSNNQAIQTQVKLGLAQLFDKDPGLNNLIGSAAISSVFIDEAKIKLKMQDITDAFWLKFFSEEQLKEVLSAVVDKGSRISIGTTGANAGINKFNFSIGDTISAMLKVTDTDTTALNSDRWMITLQHQT